MRTFYLHTIEGKPAYFSRSDGQIVFAEDDTWRDKHGAQYVRSSVRQIRRDQQTTIRNRVKWFGEGKATDLGRYGYVRVVVPT